MAHEDAKQWIASRIDYKHEIYLEELSVEESRLDSISNSIYERIKNGRNYLLSVTGIILTILLGFLSANILDHPGFYMYLGIDLFCGFIVFIITNKISSYCETMFGVFSEIYIDAQIKISYSRSVFANLTDNLEKTSTEYLQNYSLFVPILLDSALVPLYIAMDKMSNNIFLADERKTIQDNTSRIKKEIDAAYLLFQNMNTASMPQDLVTYVKTQFIEYQKIQKSPQG